MFDYFHVFNIKKNKENKEEFQPLVLEIEPKEIIKKKEEEKEEERFAIIQIM